MVHTEEQAKANDKRGVLERVLVSSLSAVKFLHVSADPVLQRGASRRAVTATDLWQDAVSDQAHTRTSFLGSSLASSAVAYMLGYGTSAVLRAAMTLLDWKSWIVSRVLSKRHHGVTHVEHHQTTEAEADDGVGSRNDKRHGV